ncbi:MAG: 3-mercaptopyruvate sulfurtransferase [Alphaproteobacteria bacterium HGW-Alphaproteobacteria-16]|nr:MAG: 3-mercaptopyruvate sulfurtransferase [Alphaproteobacteria bacterium HGW-Alphaproteobacteria-16]
MDSLISTDWLADHLHDAELRILDATWFLPDAGKDAQAAFAAAHIPGAVFFDINAVADRDRALPTMLPPADQFAAQLGALGVGDGDRIVLYDDAPHHTSARAWWMLRSFGVEAAILDGGLAKWRAEGRPVESGVSTPSPRTVTVKPNPALIRSREQVMANLVSHAEQVADARSPARFTGQEVETRPGLASGHIPGSANLPYSSFFNPDGTWKHPATLRLIFEDEGVEVERPVIATCGSGISAAVIVFALHLLGHPAALYDGSWVEWGAHPDTPKATGAA